MEFAWGRATRAHHDEAGIQRPTHQGRRPPRRSSSACWRLLHQVSGDMPVGTVRVMDDVRAQSTAVAAFRMWLMTLFGGAAMLLAVLGVYGVVAYTVQQRTREMGIRLALGADPMHVRNRVLLQGMSLASLGIVVGVAASFGLTRVLASVLFGVTPHDRLVFVAVPVGLAAVAFAAVWVPARRAAAINPVIALRAE
jgi:putative ABC transport system permease protein